MALEEENSTTAATTSRWKDLINEPKGKLGYRLGESFLLHVHWEAPNLKAAQNLLEGLRQCAVATHRDTPCVPLYFFRISNNDTASRELASAVVRLVRDHAILQQCKKKVARGIPKPAILRELVDKYKIDASLLDADDDTELPLDMQVSPIAVEFTELYLDERAFLEHSASRDYLDGYGIIMEKSNLNRTPKTIRLGTPPQNVIERILEPALKEIVVPVPEPCSLWKQPPETSAPDMCIFLSLDVNADAATNAVREVAEKIPAELFEYSMISTVYRHPLHEEGNGLIRIFLVLASLPPVQLLESLQQRLDLVRGESHTNKTASAEYVDEIREVLKAAGLDNVTVNASEYVGYVCHDRVHDIRVEEYEKTALNSII